MIERITELYLDIIPFSEFKRYLREELLTPDDIIKTGDEYNDTVETRYSINKHLSDLAKRIRELPYVKSCNPDPSPKRIKRGLSVYVEVKFNHPDGLTDDEIDKYYRYTIRFSDHFDKHEKERTHKTDKIDLVGRKVKKLKSAGIKKFFDSLPQIQDNIRDFENSKFGKQITFLEHKNIKLKKLTIREGRVKLNERLEEISSQTFCTDSANDIANWLLNRPKAYRILYDKVLDVWCIADALKNTHKDMSIDMFDSGYLYSNPDHIDLDSYVLDMRKEKRFNDGYTDAEVYSDYSFRELKLLGCFFIPDGQEYRDYEESGFYSVKTKITTGTIFTQDRKDLENFFTPLYNKLRIADAFVKEDVTDDDYIWLKHLAELAKDTDPDDWTDEFYYLAIEDGYTEDQSKQFLDKYMLELAASWNR